MARRPYTRSKPPIPSPSKQPKQAAPQPIVEWKTLPWGKVGWHPTSRTYSVTARIVVAGVERSDAADGFKNRGDVVAWLRRLGITWDPAKVDMK